MELADLRKRLLELPGASALPGGRVLLFDPSAAAASREEASVLAQASAAKGERGEVLIATGGTGGRLKLARHSFDTLIAAADAFRAHYCIHKVNTLELLPPHHISGLMSRLRAWRSGGMSLSADWRAVVAGSFPNLPSGEVVCSLVPTQLARLLASPLGAEWLGQFACILVGGGPMWPALVRQARSHSLALSPCYGSTETAAMVCGVLPSDWSAGRAVGVGRPLPHAKVSVDSETGRLSLETTSLFFGYAGEADRTGPWVSGDLGEIDAAGNVVILGRADDVIITGGKKVSQSWVEGSLKGALGLEALAVIGMPDSQWGEALVLCVDREPNAAELDAALAALEPYQRPKQMLVAPELFGDVRGKIDRARARVLAGGRARPIRAS